MPRCSFFKPGIQCFAASFALWFLTSSFVPGVNDYKAAAVYVVAHHDDWQLFMGRDFLKDAADSTRHLILIITTMGSDQHRYCSVREAGAVASINYAAGVTGIARDMIDSYTEINGFTIPTYRVKNITAFFLRIPDGNVDGEGFSSLNSVSLTKLQNNCIGDIMTSDSLNYYKDWEDLSCLLLYLTDAEIGQSIPAILHIPDTSEALNPKDHPDHIASANLALTSFSGKKWTHLLYQEYNTEYLPGNLSAEDSLSQQRLFNAYNDRLTQIMGYCTTCYSKSYQIWCGRLYKREE